MRRLAFAAAPLALLALPACGPVNRGLESVHQPVVARTDYVFDVAAGGYGLAPGEAERLAAWFETMHVGYGDRIAIDDAAHAGGTPARDAVATAAARYGLLLADTAPITEGEVAPGTVRIVISRSRADVPDCNDWRDTSSPNFMGPNFAASTSSSHGCAINGNLAAMVADPQDLLQGRTADAGVPDARSTARAIKAYRDTAPSGAGGALKAESSKGGK